MKLSPEQLAAAVLDIEVNRATYDGDIDAKYLQKYWFSDLSLGTIQRVATLANDAGLIFNGSYHGARRNWKPSTSLLIAEIKKLREGMKP